MIDDDDFGILDEIENNKKKRPELAKLLSRQDVDSFELDMVMLGDE